MKFMKTTLLAAILPLVITSLASAQSTRTTTSTFPKPTPATRSEWVPHFGIIAGLTSPEGAYDNTGLVGLDFGYQPYIPFGVGGELSYYRANGDGANSALERTQLLGKATYNFGGERFLIKYSYIGLGLGAIFDNSEAHLVSAPMVGFDIPVASIQENPITLGANARYAILEGSAPDAFSLNGELKVWY